MSSTQWRASLIIEAEVEGEAEKERAGPGADGAEPDVTGKCNSITTWQLH